MENAVGKNVGVAMASIPATHATQLLPTVVSDAEL